MSEAERELLLKLARALSMLIQKVFEDGKNRNDWLEDVAVLRDRVESETGPKGTKP